MAKKRSFKKLREHLTSKEVDKKITYLESQMPTNNTAFVFGGDPGNPQGNSFETIVDGETDSTDYTVGENPTNSTEARDTSGLFTTGGDHSKGEYVKTEEPPGDTSYILGPMAAMYYTWAYPWTMIGYIRESDRKMVNLGRIDGKFSDWNGSVGNANSGSGTFYSYGQLTTEQALWFYNIAKANGNTNDPATYSYRAFYPGPPSATPDAYGRYPCILTGVSKRTPRSVPNATPLDKQSGDNYSAMQAQQQGSGFMSFKPDLAWFKKNNKKPKGAPADWNNMSDDEKANWISQNQPEERFNYEGGRFRPDQNNAQSNRSVNPYDIFSPQPNDVPFSFGMNNPLNVSTDPVQQQQPNNVPFSFGVNNPLNASDPRSLDYEMGNEGQGNNKFAEFITRGLKGVNNILGKITNNPIAKVLENILPSKIIADTITDTIFGVDDSTSYNGQLGLQLFNNVLTGNNARIKLTPKGKRNMFNSIDAEKISDAIQFRPPSEKSHENAIRPNGKRENVLTGGWEAQGGSEFSYDPKTKLLTIHSNKMLRKMDGDKVNSKGKTVEFEDIPNPTTEQINKLLTDQPGVQKFFDLATDVPGVKAGYSKEEAIRMMNEHVPNFVKAVYNFAVEGTASNAVQLRKEMIKNGYTKETQSEKEGEGFGGHTYSQESMHIDDLKPDVRNAILNRLNQQNTQESVSLERKREIFGHLTKPVILPETKQKTYKVSPGQRYRDKNKKPEKTNFQGMDKLFNKYDNAPQPFKPQERTSWTKDFIRQNIMQSQEKMNGVLEMIGDGKHAFDYATNEYKKMGVKELEQYWGKNPNMYSFLFNGKKYNVTRKEHIENDSIVFMEDQKGVKSNMLQSVLNDKLQEQNEKWIREAYFKSHPVIPEKKESTYELIKRRFLENKKIAPEFPEKEPPKMINGFHPEYGKRSNRYKKLDPASANAMPLTGDPETDEIVRKQKTINKIKSMKKKA